MGASYAVKWREPGGQTFLGRFEFDTTAVVLTGRNDGEEAVRRMIGFDEVRGFRLGENAGERLDGERTLVVGRSGGDFVIASVVMQTGVLQELVHRLSELRLLAPRRVN